MKVKKATTTQDNANKTLPNKREKTICQKGELYDILEIRTTTQGDEGCTQLLDYNLRCQSFWSFMTAFLKN